MRSSKLLSIYILMLGVSAANCSWASEKIENAATKILLDACPRLANLKEASEISSMTASFQPTEVFYEQDMGWKDIVEIVVTLSSSVKGLPRDFYASGQVCTYDVGHGGIVTSKTPCKKICDFDTSGKGAVYVAVPATQALNLSVK